MWIFTTMTTDQRFSSKCAYKDYKMEQDDGREVRGHGEEVHATAELIYNLALMFILQEKMIEKLVLTSSLRL